MKKTDTVTNYCSLMMPAILFVIALNTTGVFGQLTEEEKFFELSGGVMRCTDHKGFGALAQGPEVDKPENIRLCKAATDAFDAASALVFGQTFELRFYTILTIAASFDPKYKSKLDAGFTVSDAVQRLKELNAVSPGYRQITLKNSYREVYGRDPKLVESKAWEERLNQQKAWYAVIVQEGIKQINQSQGARAEMINLVFNDCFGREADAAEMKKWLPRTEHARLIVAANRNYLYSSDGAAELKATFVRAYKKNNPDKPASGTQFDSFVESQLSLYKNVRWIYSQMIGSGTKKNPLGLL